MGLQDDLQVALGPIVIARDNWPEKKPLLAHYTSMQVLEAIAAHGEIWMSHPLLMNDTQELMGGLDAARPIILAHSGLQQALGEHFLTFARWYETFETQFLNDDALDTYLFCLSEHDPNDLDGSLSMWRGYGGNGGGAALIFNTNSLVDVERTPFILSRVTYLRPNERDSIFLQLGDTARKVIAREPATSQVAGQVAMELFRAVLQAALFTKHHGFREEQEWRLVYMKDLDPSLPSRRFHVHFGPRGAEPKLRLPIADDPLLSLAPISFDTLIDRILLGPTASSRIAMFAVQRMLFSHEHTMRVSLRVSASSTPYRVLV